MDKYLALGDYKAYVIDADDWDSAVWKAEQHFGSALYSITKMPKENEDERLDRLTEADLIELEDRFGKNVRMVVEDMLKGEGKRWTR